MIITETRQRDKIAVIGMDNRQKELVRELKLRFQPSSVIHAKTPEDLKSAAGVIVLPVKASEELFSDMGWMDQLEPDTLLLAGLAGELLREACGKRQLKLISYLDNTEFKIANAVPTSEGAIRLYMELSGQTVAQSRMLVLGFGHCGKALSIRLKALGADVTVFARSPEDRIYGKTLGIDMREYKQLPKLVRQKACIFNTVPERLLDGSILTYMPRSNLIIDLASAPGGTDFSLCEKMKLTAVLASSLPGRFFPKTAGKILADTVAAIINDQKEDE